MRSHRCPMPFASKSLRATGAARGRRGTPSRRWPVRSSALGEDSARRVVRRPAGELPLGAWRRARLRRGARLLGEPLHPQAISYRLALGSSTTRPAMGVTVQVMVDAEVSGVLFTCNPVSGDPSMVARQRELGPRDRRRRRRADAGRLPREQDHGRGRSPDGEHEARRVRARPMGRGTVRWRCPLSDATSRVSATRRSLALRRGRAAHRAPLRRSPGRRVGDRTVAASCPEALLVVQARPVTTPSEGGAEAVGVRRSPLVLSTFGASGDTEPRSLSPCR